jgi:hypothetical protein
LDAAIGMVSKIHGVPFTIKVNDHCIPVKLPARVGKAQAILKRQWDAEVISDAISKIV